MKIDVSKLREFFRRTGKLEEQTWDENIYVPIKKTVQPDERLSFNETFKHINKQLTK
jgi:hypothetical protein